MNKCKQYVLHSDATRSGMHASNTNVIFFYFMLFLVTEILRTYCHPAGASSATNSEFWDRIWILHVGLWANVWTPISISLSPFLVFDWCVGALLSIFIDNRRSGN